MAPKFTPWFVGSDTSLKEGWYERDHTGCTNYKDEKDRGIFRDWWMPATRQNKLAAPGMWWTLDPVTGFNDASFQQLPWRGLTRSAGPVVSFEVYIAKLKPVDPTDNW